MSFGKVFILGDSYSTYEGWNPKDYLFYYSDTPSTEHDLDSVEQTWWHRVLTRTGSELVHNESYSGSTVCATAYEGKYRPDTCFVGRLEKLVREGFFKENAVDTFFILGGTNDDWAHSPVGEIKTEDITEEDLKSFAPAMCYLLSLVKRELPAARVVVILNCDLNPTIADLQRRISEIYGVECIMPLGIDKAHGHPSRLGMEQLADQILEMLA